MNANQFLQRGGGLVRGSVTIAVRLGVGAVGQGIGLIARARQIGRPAKPGMDDATLTRKVETEIFRGRGVPKSTVNVNVADGIVWLRGEVKRPQQIRQLESRTLAIPEVRGVENLLHVTKTLAATRADTPARQQRTRSSTRRPNPRTRRRQGRVTDDRTDSLAAEAEPSPTQHAAEHEGRTPAPLGSTSQEAEPRNSSGEDGAGADVSEPSPIQHAAQRVGRTPAPFGSTEPEPDA